MLSMVVDAVLRSSTHTVVWLDKKSKQNSCSKMVGEVQRIGGGAEAMIYTREKQKAPELRRLW